MTAVCAAQTPTVDELIKRAIDSLENTSFEGRMRYSDPNGSGEERLVEIIFLSPSSFRVQPLINDRQKAGYFFIEDADRLVKVFQDGVSVVEMAERKFIIDNLMRRRLLETLAGRTSVNLLHGEYNGEPVWILRDEGVGNGTFSITIHVSERSDYPISLEMIEASGRRIFYEMEEVMFLDAGDIPLDLFEVPAGRAARSSAPDIADVEIPERSQGRETEQNLRYTPRSPHNAPGAADDDMAIQNIPMPMMPTWLPSGYSLISISPLDYSEEGRTMLVYQLEFYNPYNNDAISIFETRSTELEELFTAGRSVGDEGYFVSSNNEGWLVAVFGKISESQFDQIFESLERDEDEALEIISRTMSREELRRWAEDVCTKEGNPVP